MCADRQGQANPAEGACRSFQWDEITKSCLLFSADPNELCDKSRTGYNKISGSFVGASGHPQRKVAPRPCTSNASHLAYWNPFLHLFP